MSNDTVEAIRTLEFCALDAIMDICRKLLLRDKGR